jgi:hypothetical protein
MNGHYRSLSGRSHKVNNVHENSGANTRLAQWGGVCRRVVKTTSWCVILADGIFDWLGNVLEVKDSYERPLVSSQQGK